MRRVSRVVLFAAAIAAAGTVTPAHAYEVPVTVTWNEPVNCVRFPCPQPVPVTVCHTGLQVCTPK